MEANDPRDAIERHHFEFRGSGQEYFRIWIVNLALSVLTLGIYSAWAKVRRQKYFYGNTTLAGHAFDYHGQPIAILKGRIIGVAMVAIYVATSRFAPMLAIVPILLFWLLMPWIVTRARMFQLRVTSYRGVRFGFRPDYGGAFHAYIVAPLAAVLSLGLATPWATRVKYRWLVDNSSYGRTAFALDVGLKPYVKAVLITAPILVVGLVCTALLMGFMSTFFASLLGVTPGPDLPQQQAVVLGLLTMAVLYPILFVLIYGLLGIWRSLVLNATFSGTTLGPVRLLSRLSARRLAWIYISNLFAIVLTVGLYAPWARVRATRYMLESIGYETTGPVDTFLSAELTQASAVGEEIGDFFNIDFGF